MLCGPGEVPRSLDGWALEPKWDGVRAIATGHHGRLSITSRLGNDVTAAYPELAGTAARLGASAILDGEIVTLDDKGRPSFERLQRRMHVRQPSADLMAEVPVLLVVFDLLWLDGELLVPLAQANRRQRLEALAGAVTVTPVLTADDGPDALLADCKAIGFEGFVAKKQDAPYTPGRRSPCWLKAKATCRRELVVGGWEPGEGSRTGRVGSLAIGWVDPQHTGAWPDGPCLRWAGQVGSGISDATLAQLQPVVERFGVPASPFLDAPRVPLVRWLQPLLVVEVAYREVTRAGTLRFPVLKGIRTDLAPVDVGPGPGGLDLEQHQTRPQPPPTQLQVGVGRDPHLLGGARQRRAVAGHAQHGVQGGYDAGRVRRPVAAVQGRAQERPPLTVKPRSRPVESVLDRVAARPLDLELQPHQAAADVPARPGLEPATDVLRVMAVAQQVGRVVVGGLVRATALAVQVEDGDPPGELVDDAAQQGLGDHVLAVLARLQRRAGIQLGQRQRRQGRGVDAHRRPARTCAGATDTGIGRCRTSTRIVSRT